LIFALALQASPSENDLRNRPGLSLNETFDIYVKSIQNSDLEGLFSTVTENSDFTFLTTNGELIDKRMKYYEFHEKWFEREGWQMPVELVEVREGKQYGYVTAVFHYRTVMPDSGKYSLDSYFTLIFHKENDMWKVVADLCTPIGQSFTDKDADVKINEKQYYLFNILKNRRTVRKFKATPIPDAHIKRILDAARLAPTAGNQQPWKFLVIRDRDRLGKLKKEAMAWQIEEYKRSRKPDKPEFESVRESIRNAVNNALSAPVYIAVLVDSEAEYPDYAIYDGTLAAENLFIAARSLGYGTGFFTSFFPEDKMREFFNIPERYRLICFTPVGEPEDWPDMPDKKKLEDVILYESFEPEKR
ncbi:MAG: nitroreductase family protein, partial [Candidatus Zixiibacteriota bacterium]